MRARWWPRSPVGGEFIPLLDPGGLSTGTVTATVQNNCSIFGCAYPALGMYFLLACADDGKVVPETDETNNCRASMSQVNVTQPDLVVTAMTNPPAVMAPGGTFPVTDTTQNQGLVPAAASTTRFYLSTDTVFNPGDFLLTGNRGFRTSILPDSRRAPLRSHCKTVAASSAAHIPPWAGISCSRVPTREGRR